MANALCMRNQSVTFDWIIRYLPLIKLVMWPQAWKGVPPMPNNSGNSSVMQISKTMSSAKFVSHNAVPVSVNKRKLMILCSCSALETFMF